MKWIYCVCFVFISVSQSRQTSVVYGYEVRPSKPRQILSLEVEPVDYAGGGYYREVLFKQEIRCKGSHKSQKIEWYDPSGNLVTRDPSQRVFVKEHIGPLKTRSPVQVLTLKNAHVEDSGLWECKAGDLSQKVPLCIIEPAKFGKIQGEEVSIETGRSTTLSCQVTGNPEPKIQWWKDKELISADDEKTYTCTKYNQQGLEGQLTIKSVTPDDEGQYVCEAVQQHPELQECSHNETSDKMRLIVNYAPIFSKPKPETIFAQSNESVILVCPPKAYPSPEFRWYVETETGAIWNEYSDKQFNVSDDGNQSVLVLTANSSTFYKQFRCNAKNEYGNADKQFLLLELQKPPKIDEVNIINATDDTIVFNVTWNEVEEYFPVEEFQILYYKKKTPGQPRDRDWNHAKKLSYNHFEDIFEVNDFLIPLFGLNEDTEYWVKLRAVNKLGGSPWSAPLLASTVAKEEEVDEIEVEQEGLDVRQPEGVFLSNVPSIGIFVGIIFTFIIVIFGGICISVIKRL